MHEYKCIRSHEFQPGTEQFEPKLAAICRKPRCKRIADKNIFVTYALIPYQRERDLTGLL